MSKARFLFPAALVCGVLLAGIFPGDAPWISDEPMLFFRALGANARGEVPRLGLVGSLGIPYGPIPLWLYQLALGVTHQLVALVFLKAVLMQAGVAVALTGIASRLKLPRGPILLVFLSPLIFFYSRILWDNVFAIPVSALMFFAYVSFCEKRSLASFLSVLVLAAALIHIHLMSLIVLVPVFAALALYERQWLAAHWKASVPSAAAFALVCYPYLRTVAASPRAPGDVSPLIGFSAAFTGIRFFNFLDFFSYFLPDLRADAMPGPSWLLPLLIAGTGLACWFFVVGIVTSLRGLSLGSPSTRDKLALIGIGTMAATFFVFFRMHGWAHPHYYNASWFIYFYFLWRYFEIPAGRIAFTVRAFYAGSMAGMLTVFIAYVHFNGGDRGGHYGATLGNQLQLLQSLRTETVGNKSVHYRAFPHAFAALQQLTRGDRAVRLNDEESKWVIDYDRDRPITTAWLKVYPK